MAKLLIVDDEAPILVVMEALFRAEGFEVVTTQDGREAARLLATRAFDLMITDVRMRPLDGFDLLRVARRPRIRLPVIMVTAFESLETREKALRMDAVDLLRKPFDSEGLVALVRKSLRQRRPGRRARARRKGL
jgi:DNA-binding response OmpR family regulator